MKKYKFWIIGAGSVLLLCGAAWYAYLYFYFNLCCYVSPFSSYSTIGAISDNPLKTDDGELLKCDEGGLFFERLRYDGILCRDAKGKRFTGSGKSYLPDGTVDVKVSFKDGRPHGLARKYFHSVVVWEIEFSHGEALSTHDFAYWNNGKLRFDILRKKGEKLFKTNSYYENGQLKEEGFARATSAFPEGLWRFYYESGKLKAERDYAIGLKAGRYSAYYENGQLKEEGYCVHKGSDLQTGDWAFYYENGRLKAEGAYFDGQKIGIWKEYYENGKLKAEVRYNEGKKEGREVLYYKNGVLAEENNYAQGKKDGICTSYYENGKIKAVGKYDEDKREGGWSFFYKSGKLKAAGVYSWDGKPADKWRFYYENEQLSAEGEYFSGKRCGPWEFYYENGQKKAFAEFSYDDNSYGLENCFTAQGAIEPCRPEYHFNNQDIE